MDFWVFGYGSLLWNPGFAPIETVAARADGWHRSFCMLSIHHRGTEDDPGLVLALDAAPGASCAGLAMRVPASGSAGVLAMLRARELVSSAYLERHLPVELADGRMVTALSYVIDPDHRQYCRFEPEVQARMIARAHGGRGPNADYLFNTAAHLRALALQDPELDRLEVMVRTILRQGDA
ncbi:MAG: gamma-glutamylcyclotransferase [Rubellimicrobium sp.]|nr:gamma-glutamylcyclotransferase [Rubellimicrobium sp.]